MNALKKIQLELKMAEDNMATYVNALKDNATKWMSIRSSFKNHTNDLIMFDEFPDLQSRLEMNQASICDTLIAEIGKDLVMFEHTIITNRGALAKAKQTLFSKQIDGAWEFPPTTTFVGDNIHDASVALEEASLSLEARRLALYKLTSEASPIEPSMIFRFVNSFFNIH